MKRYFLVRDEHMPTIKERFGQMTYIDLVTHGPAGDEWNLVCLHEEWAQPKPSWVAFPAIYDAKTTLAASAIPHEVLADVGLTGEETTIEAIYRFGEINPLIGV